MTLTPIIRSISLLKRYFIEFRDAIYSPIRFLMLLTFVLPWNFADLKAAEIEFDYYLADLFMPRDSMTLGFINTVESAFPLGARYKFTLDFSSLTPGNFPDAINSTCVDFCYPDLGVTLTGPGLVVSPPHPVTIDAGIGDAVPNSLRLRENPFSVGPQHLAHLNMFEPNFMVFGREPASRGVLFTTFVVEERARLELNFSWSRPEGFQPEDAQQGLDELIPFEFGNAPGGTGTSYVHLSLIDFGKNDSSFTQPDSITLAFAHGGREYFWDGGSGDFLDADKWLSANNNDIPGSGVTPLEVVRITENGNYVVSGTPEEKLLILNAGNDVGSITLAPLFDKYHVDQFLVDGDVALQFGEVDVDQRVEISPNSKLTIGQNGILNASEGASEFEVPSFTLLGELNVQDQALVSSGEINVAGQNSSNAELSVSGLTASLDIAGDLNIAGGDNSEATFSVSDGALLTLTGALDMAEGEQSRANALITGNITTVRGTTPTEGISGLDLGTFGEATLQISDNATVSLQNFLSLGFGPGQGALSIDTRGKLITPDRAGDNAVRGLEVVIGQLGSGEVTVRSGGEFFTTSGLSNGANITLGEFEGSSGKLDIDHFNGTLVDENLFTDFTETTVGAAGAGEWFLGEGAKWRSENFVIGEAASAEGIASVVGETAELALYGSRLLLIGGEGKGSLTIRDGARVIRSEQTGVTGDSPLDVLVGFNQSTNLAQGELIVFDGVLAGGEGSSIKIGSTASGAIGRAEFSDSAIIDIEQIRVGFNSLKPGEVASPPVVEELQSSATGLAAVAQITGTSAANVPAGFFPSDAHENTTGLLMMSNGAFLNAGDGLGSVIIGSRGYFSVESGARIETGLLQIGIEQAALADIPRFAGEGAVVRVSGTNTRIDASILTVGPTDEFAPISFFGGNDIQITDGAVLNIGDGRIDGRTSFTISGLGALVADTLEIGGTREAPTPAGPNGPLFDERLASVSVETGGFLNAAVSIIVGDNTVAGAFEPLATFALLSVDEFSSITTEHLIIANGGALAGNNISVNATTTEVFAGAIAPGFSPGTLHFNGDLIFHEGARLIIEIGGDDPSLVDQITVAGSIMGEATLDLRFVDGFVPEVGKSFDFFSAQNNSTPTFNEILISGLGEGAVVNFSNSLSLGGRLTVIDVGEITPVPLPASVWLMVGAVSFLLRFRSRRRVVRETLPTE